MESTKFTCKHGSTEMLNDRNYHSWKRSLKAFLIAEDAFGIVTGTEAPPNTGATAQLRDFRRRSGRAYSLIYASSDETTRSLIDNLPTKNPTTCGLPCVWHSILQPPCPDDLRPFAVSTRLQ